MYKHIVIIIKILSLIGWPQCKNEDAKRWRVQKRLQKIFSIQNIFPAIKERLFLKEKLTKYLNFA